jgi:hypothetical protein
MASLDGWDNNRVPVWFWRAMVPTIIGVIVAPATIVLGQPLHGSLFLVAVLWNGYWWCWRLAFELTVTDRAVHWRGAFRVGSVPLADVVAIEPALLQLVVSIRSRQGRLVVSPSAPGLLDTINRMRQRSPTIALNLSPKWLRSLDHR